MTDAQTQISSKQSDVLAALKQAFSNLKLPEPNSHKGQNGKLLIIGGSQLFHAASKWSLDIASKFVDMVFYASVPENNELIKQAKQNFWNGIVIERTNIPNYIAEADCILIGPGMERQNLSLEELQTTVVELHTLTPADWKNNTAKIINSLLKTFPNKKWVIDAGALQMVLPSLLNNNCIITPHAREMEMLEKKQLLLDKTTILLKGSVDQIILSTADHSQFANAAKQKQTSLLTKRSSNLLRKNTRTHYEISGGNAGMTKGGTGDVLAGLTAALYCTNNALISCLVASHINKKAGDELYKTVGPFFNASDLVKKIPEVLWRELEYFGR